MKNEVIAEEGIIFDQIPFVLNPEAVKQRLRFYYSPDEQKIVGYKVQEMIKSILPIVRPRAIYKTSQLKWKTSDDLEIDGVKFTGSLLRVNLEKVKTVFPYVVTCGGEIESISCQASDPETRRLFKVVSEKILLAAFDYIRSHLSRRYRLNYIWTLNPGEFQSWPINQRKQLFSILGDVNKAIGVSLNTDYSLQPACSQTGILYHAEVDFESCQLCSNRSCMMRRAPYNPEITRQKLKYVKNSCASNAA